VVVARHWADGGKGAEELARTVVDLIETTPTDFKFVYEDSAATLGQDQVRRHENLWRCRH
jgi:formyltetrahydrofolate synthetase